MRRERLDVGSYYKMAPRKRINGIINNIDGFKAVMDNYEHDLSEWIEDNRVKARRDAVGNLGVRIQSGRNDFSLTAARAEEAFEIETIMTNYELTPSCKGIEDYEEIERGLLELSLMRREYGELLSKISELTPRERALLKKYVMREDRTSVFSDELSISVESVWKKIYRIKKKIYSNYVSKLKSYDDDSIYVLRICRRPR